MVVEDFVVLFADSDIPASAGDESVELVAEKWPEHVGIAAGAQKNFVAFCASFGDCVNCALRRSVFTRLC